MCTNYSVHLSYEIMFDYTQCPSLQRSYIWQLHLLLQSVPDTTTIIFPFRRGIQDTNLSVTNNMSVVLSGYLKMKDNQQSLSSFCLGMAGRGGGGIIWYLILPKVKKKKNRNIKLAYFLFVDMH